MKNVGLTLDAFERVREESRSEVRLVVVGRLTREAIVRLQGSPALKGAVDIMADIGEADLAKLYASAVATVHPARHEGFGLVPLESMRLGTPAIVSGKGAMAEVCDDAATVVEIRDPQPLANAMLDMLVDGVSEAEVARGIRVASKYTWQDCTEKVVRTYEDVLGVLDKEDAGQGAGRAASVPA